MSILVFVHAASEGPAELGRTLQRHGHRLRHILLYAGQSVPADFDDVDGIVSMGGPMNVDEAAQHAWMAEELRLLKTAHEAGVPIVGVCLGAQLIVAALGGQVAAMPRPPGPEIGFFPVKQTFPGTTDPLYAGIPWTSIQFHIHGQEVTKLPAEAVVLAGSQVCKVQAFRAGLTTYAFQYHFEWDRHELEAAARDPFVTQSGLSPDAIITQFAAHYDAYRRLGDRLCDNIANYLMPVDKRLDGQRNRKRVGVRAG